jgi:pimeloyl-ACP methyl ester carboxylesterase
MWVKKLSVLGVLASLASSALAWAAGPADTTIHYYSGWKAPHAVVQGENGWTPGQALRPEHGRPGWWSRTVPGRVRGVVFHEDQQRAWDNPGRQPGSNYENRSGLKNLWVKDGRVSYLPPENVQTRSLPAPTLGPGVARKVTVVYPPDYDASSPRRYPVVYLFDGQNLASDGAPNGGWKVDQTLGEHAQSGRAQSVIIVGIHFEDRIHELTSLRDDRKAPGGGGADRYLDFLAKDVVPWAERTLPVRPGVEHRALGGSSLGGLATLHALAKRPELFTKGIVLSPSVWWAKRAILGELKGNRNLDSSQIYLYHGGIHDGLGNGRKLKNLLLREGMKPGKNFFYDADESGTHTESAWVTPFGRGLDSLFPGIPAPN